MKIIGYGICGPGEADRYMKETLDEFKRLCDEVVILCNNCDQKEIDLIQEYGFKFVRDRREWGKHQWRIKQDFIERDILQLADEGDMIVCLDMDETIPALTKEWLMAAEMDAYHVFIADLWNDPEHYKLESCFWNVRIWRWNGETKWKAKPVHCGLAPEWTYLYHRHAPFVLLHKGLMAKEDRQRKIKRYETYDPHATHLDRKYYDMLKDDTAEAFDFEKLQKEIEKEVATYKQTKPKPTMATNKGQRFAYVRNPHGEVLDIPERHLERTMKQPGFTFLGMADEQDNEIEEMFQETEVEEQNLVQPPHAEGSYQPPVDNAIVPPEEPKVEEENPMPNPNEPKAEEKPKPAAKKTAKKATKKAAKKTTKKK